MFNLEHAVADWRRQMLAAGIKTPVPLEELEDHLREDVEQRMRSGLTEPQAFEAAAQRVGQARVLNNEFLKVHGTKKARQFIKNNSFLILGVSGVVCLAIGFFRYWVTMNVALAFAHIAPGTSNFYAAADRSLTLSLLMLCFGAALLLASSISYLTSRGRKARRYTA
jgi:hypothetical protein